MPFPTANDNIANAFDLNAITADGSGHKSLKWPGPGNAVASIYDNTMEAGEQTHIPDWVLSGYLTHDVGTAWFKYDCDDGVTTGFAPGWAWVDAPVVGSDDFTVSWSTPGTFDAYRPLYINYEIHDSSGLVGTGSSGVPGGAYYTGTFDFGAYLSAGQFVTNVSLDYFPATGGDQIGVLTWAFSASTTDVLEFVHVAGTTHYGMTVYRVPTGTAVTAADPGELLFAQGQGAGTIQIWPQKPGYTYYFQVSWKQLAPSFSLPPTTRVVFHLHPKVAGDDFASPVVLPSSITGSTPVGLVQYATAEEGEVWSEFTSYPYPVKGSSWYRWTSPKTGIFQGFIFDNPNGYYGVSFGEPQFYSLYAWDADELLYLPRSIWGTVDPDGHLTPHSLAYYDPYVNRRAASLAVEKDKTYIFGLVRLNNESDAFHEFTPGTASTASFDNVPATFYWEVLPPLPDLAGAFGDPHAAFTPAGPTP